MLNFVITLSDYDQEETSQMIKRWIEGHFKGDEGICYYRYPLVKTERGAVPDFTIFTRKNHPLIIRCLPYQINEIDYIEEVLWIINQMEVEPPFWDLELFQRGLSKQLRDNMPNNHLRPRSILALPLISQEDFEHKFGPVLDDVKNHFLWAGGNTSVFQYPLDAMLSDDEWILVKTISQGVLPRINSQVAPIEVTTLGAAIRRLDTQIRSLDDEQVKVATQIAPGPQRIRGLAGTGKTVLLAMRAANIHLRNPQSKILFTFHTQSLYNQARSLIREFYRTRSQGAEPNWEYLHIRHSWGGQRIGGVYSELSVRQGVNPLRYSRSVTLQICCSQALTLPIAPEYEYILVDEAQDFPKEFFQVLYKLSFEPHRIYWAYDELQSLSSLEIPKPEELFGNDENGVPLVTLNGDDYPGGIEKDFVLHRSYRCPQKVLMLAHALGLGIYSSRGPIQMLGDKGSWKSIGYEIESGQFQTGEDIVITRPAINSPNRIGEIYSVQDLVAVNTFQERTDELDWIAESICKDVQEEFVEPEHILVISLNNKKVNEYLLPLNQKLSLRGIASIVPGFNGSADKFAMPGHVTLATVYRAKGNEAYIVYILGFDYLYDYLGEIGSRNQAFTSITRSKAWVRITGTGEKMKDVRVEIDKILKDFPLFKFKFPDMNAIRSLDAEDSLRRRAVSGGNKYLKALSELGDANQDALEALNPEMIEKVKKMLNSIRTRDQK